MAGLRFCAGLIDHQRAASSRDMCPGCHGDLGWTGIVAAMEQRDERIIVETARYRLTGILRLPRDGYRSRLTDYLNAAERNFLPLTDVEIAPLDGGELERRAFVALSLSQIVLAMPDDASQTAA